MFRGKAKKCLGAHHGRVLGSLEGGANVKAGGVALAELQVLPS